VSAQRQQFQGNLRTEDGAARFFDALRQRTVQHSTFALERLSLTW
jgi:hypothetical protein